MGGRVLLFSAWERRTKSALLSTQRKLASESLHLGRVEGGLGVCLQPLSR